MSIGVTLKFNEKNGQHYRTNESEDGTMRLCTGPAHDEPTWLPNTEKYFYVHRRKDRGTQEMSSRCRLCNNWSKLKTKGSTQGWVLVSLVRPFFVEAVNRVGITELSRRAELNPQTIRRVYNGTGRRVQKATVRAVMLQLISMRRKSEVRHRDSISYGATVRKPHVARAHKRRHRFGKILEIPEKVKAAGKEKEVTDFYHDLLHPHGDNDNQKRRDFRARTGK